MRAIKFRSWTGPWASGKYRMIYSGDLREKDNADNFSFDNGILMQFTGLFDDTGKEIYEGDIVEVTEMKTPPHRAVVHFDFRGAWIEANPLRKELGFSHIQLLYDYCDYGFGRGILSTCKVIGNIYENPELLEVSE
jgi:hypothetical protein